MTLPGLVAAQNLADIADREKAWDNLGLNISALVVLDQNARAYIAAVEAVDGQSLELSAQLAINDFIVGCKADGIWSAIKASCILAGARTLNGALVPLVGTAPTNFNFVAGDYNRKTGLIGNRSTKYLDSNRADNADPQNNAHLSLFVSSAGTGGAGTSETYIGGGDANAAISLRALIRLNEVSVLNGLATYNRFSDFNLAGSRDSVGFVGSTRSTSTGFVSRLNAASTFVTAASRTTDNTTLGIFAERRDGATFGRYASCRLAFYSLGESLDLALLDARVTTLMNAFAAAIP